MATPPRITILLPGLFVLLSLVAAASSQVSERDRELAKAAELTSEIVKLFDQKRYKDALPPALKVVEVRRRLLAENDRSLAAAYTNLAEIYFQLKKDREAEDAFTDALTVYEKQTDPPSGAISKTLERLAFLRFRKNDYAGADRYYLRALELKEKELGVSNPQTIAAMKNFGCLDLIAKADNHALPEDSDENKRRLRARAACWLHEMSDDCASIDPITRPDQGIVNSKAIKLTQPAYPAAARSQGHAGNVFIAVLIGKEGTLIKTKSVCGGYPELIEAGVEAARASKFTPTLLNGQPVEISGTIIYRFVAK